MARHHVPSAPVEHLVGVLVRRHGVTSDVALAMLERAARRKRVSVHDLAAAVTGIATAERAA